jgi:hypothetical protein
MLQDMGGRRTPAKAISMAALLAMLAPVVHAQGLGPQAAVTMGDITRRDVRIPDSVPNISGVWSNLGSNRTIAPLDGGPTPFLPWAQAFFEERAAAEAKGAPIFDPNASCLPSGVPRAIPMPYPIDIVQFQDVIVITLEVMHSFRVIHMDGRSRPAGWTPSYLGYSTGHWDGEALVVETTGLNGYTQVDEEGRPKSTDMRVVERYQKVAPDTLEITFVMDDAKTYSRPWTARARFRWAPGVRQQAYICEENNRNKPDASGKLRPH